MATSRCLAIGVLLFAYCQVDIGHAKRVELRLSDLDTTNSRRTMIDVREGEPLELMCEADVDDSPMILKYRGVIFNPSKPGVSWITETLTRPDGKEVLLGKLNIDKVTLEDHGDYQCQLELDLLDEKTVGVQVRVTKIKALQISADTNRSHFVTDGDSDIHLSLRCNGEHDTNPVWYLDGSQLDEGFSADKKVMTTINVVASRDDNIRETWLTRQTDEKSQLEGRYQCVDANHYMTDSEEFVVSGIGQTVVSSLTTLFVIILATIWPMIV